MRDLGLNDQQSLSLLTRGLIEQSYLLSSLDYFYASTWVALSLAIVVWFTRRPRVASGLAAAAE